MTNKQIKDLLDLIKSSDLEEVSIRTDSFSIRVKRSASASYASAPILSASSGSSLPASSSGPASAAASSGDAAPAPESSKPEEGQTITSPMVGTFYRSPKPKSPPFVEVGDKIRKGQVICIIEAMKLFNEIESEVSGTVLKVLVDDATAVEYDAPLFLVKPD